MNILFFHNTIASYRLPFFRQLSKMSNLKVCLTNPDLTQKIYGNTVGLIDEKFDVDYVPKTKISKFLFAKMTEGDYELCVLPTLDSFRDAIISYYICKNKKNNTKLGYFWEKWEPSKDRQPFLKKMKNLLQRSVARFILRNVDVIWYPGVKTKEYFVNLGIEEQHLFKIHDTSMMEIREDMYPQHQNNKIRVLYFGRVIERKGLRVLIEAFNKLKDDSLILTVAGDGEQLNEFKELVNKYNIQNIQFVGYVNPSDRYKYFLNTDIFVLPSIIEHGVIEAWGLTVNEAIQCKKFIIASDAVGSAFDLINDNNGIIVKENDVDDLADALVSAKKVYGNRSVILASEKILEDYNYLNMAEDILKPFK